eukprot:scaffold115920_cov57-Phaeocystis_antarctica.AAC.2
MVGEVVGARGASLGGPYGAAVNAHSCVAVDESRRRHRSVCVPHRYECVPGFLLCERGPCRRGLQSAQRGRDGDPEAGPHDGRGRPGRRRRLRRGGAAGAARPRDAAEAGGTEGGGGHYRCRAGGEAGLPLARAARGDDAGRGPGEGGDHAADGRGGEGAAPRLHAEGARVDPGGPQQAASPVVAARARGAQDQRGGGQG